MGWNVDTRSMSFYSLSFLYSRQYLTRVDRLKQKRETHKGSSTLRKENSEDFGDQASEDSEDELEDMLNWRAKKA